MDITPVAVTIKTLDGIDIAGTFYDVPDPKGGVVFLHMMPAVKDSWDELALRFAGEGYLALAIDLRGHGESEGGPNGYTKYTDEEHQKSILDVDAAVKYLLAKGVAVDRVVLMGASIGANLALKYIADHPDFKTAILLSAGSNYRGIMTLPAAEALKPAARMFFVTSRDDNSNSDETQKIFSSIPKDVEKRLHIYEHAGHGTNMLGKEPKLTGLIMEFVKATSGEKE
ncbi:MAG: alpha/beta fold hydrolase [bacterium]|nr:alpha/beta fold hydrolase [bacterium]